MVFAWAFPTFTGAEIPVAAETGEAVPVSGAHLPSNRRSHPGKKWPFSLASSGKRSSPSQFHPCLRCRSPSIRCQVLPWSLPCQKPDPTTLMVTSPFSRFATTPEQPPGQREAWHHYWSNAPAMKLRYQSIDRQVWTKGVSKIREQMSWERRNIEAMARIVASRSSRHKEKGRSTQERASSHRDKRNWLYWTCPLIFTG